MNSQKVPKVVEVPKQQFTDLNVDEPAEMQRQITSTHRKTGSRTGFSPMYEREETLSRHNDTCQ